MGIRVLVVEDDRRTVALHAQLVGGVPGFEVAGTACSIAEALRALGRDPAVDVILLDFDLPDGHGLAVVRALRAAGHRSDVIAVTAAREVDEVQRAVAHGVVGYLIQPSTQRIFRDRLLAYADYRRSLTATAAQVDQGDVDALFGALRPPPAELPKGLAAETLRAIREALAARPDGASAGEIAAVIGATRVTARRYLEHLAETGGAVRGVRYGGRGRPELQYLAAGEGSVPPEPR